MLDDDEDMAEMYLTDKLQQQLENDSVTSINEQDGMDEQVLHSNMGDRFASFQHIILHCNFYVYFGIN